MFLKIPLTWANIGPLAGVRGHHICPATYLHQGQCWVEHTDSVPCRNIHTADQGERPALVWNELEVKEGRLTETWTILSMILKHFFFNWVLWENFLIYCQASNISRILEGNKTVDHSDVVGASPVGAAPTTSSFLT